MPWWGGIFKRIVKSAKRCLKKSIGQECLTYNELLTVVTEVEAVLNSRPVSYVSSEDTEKPLTPSHLLVGYRVLSPPDPSVPDDPKHSSNDITCWMKHLLNTPARFLELVEERVSASVRTQRVPSNTILEGTSPRALEARENQRHH